MRKLTLEKLSDKRAIRLAELAFASKIQYPLVHRALEEVEVLYVFDIRHRKDIDEDYIKKYGIGHVKIQCDWLEIDSSFNTELNGGNTCNMMLIYKLLLSWGADIGLDGTGLFPKTKTIPKDLSELETIKSESLK